MNKTFRVALDWTSIQDRLPVNRWLTRQVKSDGGFARFRCDRAGVELYVDCDGYWELRDINDAAKVLVRQSTRPDTL